MRIAAYCRVSTDKTDQQNSLEAQKYYFNEYAAKSGHTLVGIYPDEGITGTSTKKRVQFNRMIDDAKAGKIDLIITKEVSRFARNTVDTLNYTRLLKNLGVGVLFLSDNINTLDNDGELRLSIMATLAQEESRKISARVKWGKQQTAKKGRVPNIVYGYNKIIGNRYDLQINEEEAYIIKRIYNMYLDEGYGATKIAIILNSEGLRTKRDCDWSQNAVCRILTNPIYTGKITNGKEETKDFLTKQRQDIDKSEWLVTEKEELRIISDELFEKAQQALNKRRTDFTCYKQRQSNQHLFSTIIKCKECGYSYARRSTKDSRPKWHCTSRNIKGRENCSNHTILGERELIEEINRYFIGLVTDRRNAVDLLVTEFKKQYKSDNSEQKDKKTLQEQLLRFDRKHNKYTEMYADDLLSKEQLKDKLQALTKEREPIEQRLAELNGKQTHAENLDEMLMQTFKNLENIADIKNMSNAQLKELIDRIEVDKDGKVDIFMRTLKDIGLADTIAITDNHTSRYNSKARKN